MLSKESEEKVSIYSRIFVIYLAYMMFVVFTEWINFIPKISLNINLPFGIAELGAGILIMILVALLYKRVNVKKAIFNPEVIFGIVLILIIGFFISLYPDGGFDTFNYHLIAQNPKFENYFVEDYGYGNFQVWGFRLCDRMFYYFRYLFGFRMGTYLNVLVLMISFIQVYNILCIMVKEEVDTGRNFLCNKLVWSLAIVFSYDAMMMMGSYYVDAVALPLALELIRLLIFSYNEKCSGVEIAYYALLSGLMIGAKLTDIIYVIPLVLLFVCMHIKDFKIKDWFIAICLGIFSWLEYIIFNWINTGNPLFPYYNVIFKSEYYPEVNFKDLRWGGQSIFEKIFWVVYAAFKPDYRQSEIWDKFNGILIIGIIGIIALVIINIYGYRKRRIYNKKVVLLSLLAIACTLLWSFTTGVGRYFMIGRVIWGLIAFEFIRKLLDFKIVGKIVATIATISVTVCVVCNGYTMMVKGRNWSWNVMNLQTAGEQLKYVFRDRNLSNEDHTDQDMYILTDYMSMGVLETINDEAYGFNTNYIGTTKLDGLELLKTKLEDYGKAYDLHKRSLGDIEEYILKLNTYNLKIVELESVETAVGEYQRVLLTQGEETEPNYIWTSSQDTLEVDVSELQGIYEFSFIGGRAYDWTDDVVGVQIFLENKDTSELKDMIQIDNKKIENYSITLDISSKDDYIKIVPIYISSKQKVSDEQSNFIFMLNYDLHWHGNLKNKS